jgi:nucleoid DNA-binding protein
MGRFASIKYFIVKIEQALVQHLYNTRKISLQGIGTFSLEGSVSTPADPEKVIVIPQNGITFIHNPRVGEDTELIDAIVQHTKKIKPLAAADLESFLTLGMQFLHIGKPFTIEGLGTLDKAQTGELVFIPGQFITPRIEAPKALKEDENEEKSGLFPDYDSEVKKDRTTTIITIAIILILGLLAWGVYYFLNRSEGDPVISTQQTKTNSNPIPVTKAEEVLSTSANENYTFVIMFKETSNKEEADKLRNKYTGFGHKIIMYTNDSITYKLAEPFTLPLSDTTRIKDSLNKFYYMGEGRVEMK